MDNTDSAGVALKWSALPQSVVVTAVELARNGDATVDDLIANGVPRRLALINSDAQTGVVVAAQLVAAVARDLGLKVGDDETNAGVVRTARAIRVHYARVEMRRVIEADVAAKKAAKSKR
jgi:hypothetical protein